MTDYKTDFSIFKNQPELVYLDNSSTTQKPGVVLDEITDFYTNSNANVHRGLYPLSELATEKYEAARKKVAEFINADTEEIIFTSGTTDSINAIAMMLEKSELVKNPSILITELEQHANILPWRVLKGSKVNYLRIDGNFQLILNDEEIRKFNPDIISMTHISNVTGTLNDIRNIVKRIRATLNKEVIFVLDAAQSIAHLQVDVKDLNVDFLAFSSHKMYGPTGIGVLYGKKKLLEKMEPFRVGGGMIREVTKQNISWAEIPEKFEAGTPAICEAIALGKSIEYIQSVEYKNIERIEQNLRTYLYNQLKALPEVKIYHPTLDTDAGAVISFTVDGVHPHDISQFLGENNICVRAGHHCAQILHRDVLKIPASVRASLGIYNTEEDIDKMIKVLKECITTYRR